MATSNANITSPVPGTTQVSVQNDAKPTVTATPRGVAGGAYEANLTAQPIQQIQANAPVNFAAQAAKVQANPQFQAAYADQTVSGRTNADRVLSGMNPQQIAQEKVKDANWNAQQAAFDAANPVGTKIPEPAQPIQPAMAQVAPQPAQNATIAPTAAPAQPTVATAPKNPQGIAASIFASKPNANQLDFQGYINNNGLAGTPQENQVWDAYHELQHIQGGMQKYGTSDVNSLSAAISNGDLAVGSPTWNALAASNPNAALAKQKYEADLRTKTNNELASSLVSKEGGQSVSSSSTSGNTLENLSNKIVSKVTDPNQIYSLADALAEIPEVSKFKSQVLAGDAQIDDLTKAKSKNYEDLKKQYPNVPQSVIMGMEAKMDKDLDDQIYNAQRDRNYASGMLTYYSDIAKSKVESRNTIAAEQRKLANDKSLQQYEAGLKPNTAAIGNDLYQYDEGTGKWSLALSGAGKVGLQQIKRTNPLTGMEETVGSFDPSTGASRFYDGTTKGGDGSPGNTGTPGTPSQSYRTDRNSNPTAMTTDVAASLGLKEGVDYTKGDPFTTSTGGTLYTAKMIVPQGSDAISTTVSQFDKAAAAGINVFQTKDGQPRWTHTNMTNAQWNALTPDQKDSVVTKMYKNEGGSGSLMDGGTSNQPASGDQISQSTVDPQTVIAKFSTKDNISYNTAQYNAIVARNGQKVANDWLINKAIDSDLDAKKSLKDARDEAGSASGLLTMLDQANYNPGTVANKLLDLKSWTGLGISDGDKQAMAVRGALIANQAKARNKLFGASLSTAEGDSANQFLALSPFETIESIKAKLKGQQTMAQIAQDNIKMRAIGVPEETIQQHEKEDITNLMGSFKSQSATSTSGQDVSSFANGLTGSTNTATEDKKAGSAWKTPSKAELEKQGIEGMQEQSNNIVKYADTSLYGFSERTKEEQKQAIANLKKGTWYKVSDTRYIMRSEPGKVFVHSTDRTQPSWNPFVSSDLNQSMFEVKDYRTSDILN